MGTTTTTSTTTSTTSRANRSRSAFLDVICALLVILAACASGGDGDNSTAPDDAISREATDDEQAEATSESNAGSGSSAPDGTLEPLAPVEPLPGLVLSIVGGTTSALDNFGRRVAWSSDESRVAVPTSTGLYVYELPDIQAPPLFLDSGLVGMDFAAFAPDDSLVAGSDRTYTVGLRIWDVETGEERAAWRLGPLLITWPEPDLMVVVEEDRVIGFDPMTGEIAWTADGEGMAPPGETAAVSADGRFVAHGATGSIVVRETTTGDEVFTTTRSADLQAMALSADGARLAAATEDSRLRIWDVGSGEPVLDEGVTFVRSLRFDDTADRLVSSGDLIATWDIDEIAAGGIRSTVRTELAYGAEWVADGVLISDWPDYLPDAIVVDPTDGSTVREIVGPTDIRIVAVSPSASQVLSIDPDEVWLNSLDGTTGVSTQEGPVEATWISTADLSVGGTHVVALSSNPGAAPILLDIDKRESEVLSAPGPWSSVAFDSVNGGIMLFNGAEVEVVDGPPVVTAEGPVGRSVSSGLDDGPTLRLVSRGRCVDVVSTTDGATVGSFPVDSLDRAVASGDGRWVFREEASRDVVDGVPIDGLRPRDGDQCRRPSVAWSIDVPDPSSGLRGVSAEGDVLVQVKNELLRLDPESGSELGRIAFALPEGERIAQLRAHPGGLVTASTSLGVLFFDADGATLGSLPVTGIVRIEATNRRALIYQSGELYVVEVPGQGG